MSNSQTPSAPLEFSEESTEAELRRLFDILHEVPLVRRHRDLLSWLQGEFQRCVPHDIMLAAWGMDRKAALYVDVVSHLPGVRTTTIHDAIKPFMRELFQRWQDNGGEPFCVDLSEGVVFEGSNVFVNHELHKMRVAVVHAIRDERSQHFCIYAALGSTPATGMALQKMKAFIPFLDSAFRQVPSLPEQCGANEWEQAAAVDCLDLSEREAEIMKWVRVGKTNHEIGLILDISAFTVKNHLQRIFRKLDVTNRAQAVARLHVDTFSHKQKASKAERV